MSTFPLASVAWKFRDATKRAPWRAAVVPGCVHRARTSGAVQMQEPRGAALTFSSPVFQHRFAFDLPGVRHHASDNYFELYPGEKKSVLIELSRELTTAKLKKLLVTRSLVDTY